jgi:hypothetical protein
VGPDRQTPLTLPACGGEPANGWLGPPAGPGPEVATAPLRPDDQWSTVIEVDDDAIRHLVTHLARGHPSGGTVVERAAIVAEGADSDAVVTWILSHGGEPEASVETSTRRGLHGARLHASAGSERAPARFVLPSGALD